MSKCMICLKEYPSLTVEHIIPLALCNKSFTIKCVCKECNSRLGNLIDGPNVNSFSAQLYRFANNIEGRSSVPNPFKEGETEDGDRVYLSDDMKPRIVPKVSKSEDGKTYHVEASSREEVISIINKKLERGHRPPLSEEQKEIINSIEPKKSNPTISYKVEFNIDSLLLEYIKIGYETLIYAFGESIVEFESINVLRDIIYNALYCSKTDKERIRQIATIKKEDPIKEEQKRVLCNFYGCTDLHFICINKIGNDLCIVMQINGYVPGALKLANTGEIMNVESIGYAIKVPSGELINLY